MQRLQFLSSQAAQWQRGEWSMAHLSRQLGIRVICTPGSLAFLGMSFLYETDRMVWLNERITGLSVEPVIIAHELSHLLLDHRGVSYCSCVAEPTRDEAQAWYGAAIMIVPTVVVRGIIAGRPRADIAAWMIGLPEQLVDLAVASWRAAYGMTGEAPARAALKRWLDFFHWTTVEPLRRAEAARQRMLIA